VTGSAIAVHYYVWYRVPGQQAQMMRAVTAMQNDVAKYTGIRGRVLWRRDDPQTWMEIYENVDAPDSFEAALAAAVRRHDADALAADHARHLEAFVAPT
jgi:Domain of unknown function (DUF4936)